MSRLNRETLARRARDIAIAQGITVREAYRELEPSVEHGTALRTAQKREKIPAG